MKRTVNMVCLDMEIIEIKKKSLIDCINACRVYMETNRHDAVEVRETLADIAEYEQRISDLDKQYEKLQHEGRAFAEFEAVRNLRRQQMAQVALQIKK